LPWACSNFFLLINDFHVVDTYWASEIEKLLAQKKIDLLFSENLKAIFSSPASAVKFYPTEEFNISN